jgi:hypothetical protein
MTTGFQSPLDERRGSHQRNNKASSLEALHKDGGPIESKNSVTFYMPEKAKDA